MKQSILRVSLLCLAVLSVAVAATDRITVANANAGIDFNKGNIHLLDAEGRQLLKVGALQFTWSPPVAVPAGAEKVDDNTVRVRYRIEKDTTGEVAVTGTFRLENDKVIAQYEISAPKGIRTGGIMQTLLPVGGAKKEKIYKSGIWTRAENNGVPYEVRDEYMKAFKGRENSFWFLVRGNHDWASDWGEHLPVKTDGEGKYKGESIFLAVPSGAEGFEAAAIHATRPVALRFSTDREFNLWESGAPEVKLEVSGTSNRSLSDAMLNVFAYDYDGRKVVDHQETLPLSPGERKSFNFSLPADERNIYFLEASVTVDGKEFFTRTNAALLPPHQYEHLEKSNIGMAAFFNEPSREAVFRLMRRMGVRHLRSGDNREAEQYGMRAFTHNNVSGKEPYSPAKDAESLQKMLEKYENQQNIGWEFCNEWGFNQNKESREKSAAVYASWLKAINEARKAKNLDINLINVGLAGADVAYLKLIVKNGGWPLVDGIALHPGRGNMTPDCLGSGWFYLGSIRRMKAAIEELGGGKPLYLTEVYACTQPNNWWVDSYRLAGENTLLTFLIGVAEQVASVQFYQMHNAVWHDIGGINHKDREFDFGLLMRDNSPKPSILAFATAAEALDGAEFVRYLTLPGTKVHGIEFRTPRGKMAVLYDRTDGYYFSKNTADFVHKEPWVKYWGTETAHTFRSAQSEITVVDTIGRSRTLPVNNGTIQLTLDGSPLIVYGLDLQ